MDKRCERGHFYDPARFSSCPHCGVPGLNVGETMPKRPPQPVYDARPAAGVQRDEKTRGVLNGMGREPVVGWVVCVAGPDRGKDFKIRPGRNFVGRSDAMQVCLSEDGSVSREKHAIISYDPKKNSFGISPGESSGLVYLNNEEVEARKELSAYDRIQLGKSELIFMPFCGERFQWPASEKELAGAR